MLSRRHASVSLLAIFAGALVGCGSPGSSGAIAADAGDPDTLPGADASMTDAADAAGDAPSPSPACLAQATSLQKALDKALPTSGSAGAVLAIRTPACGLWVGASGTSTKTIPLAPTDVLRVGSITKTFVSAAVLQLVTAGTVSLKDSLEKWLPGFPNGAGITLTELLNHTSGIFDYTQDATWQQTVSSTPGTVWTPAQLVTIAASHPPSFAPGQGWGYSNTDYILLGQLLEKVTGKPAGSVLHQDGIDPAALESTSFPGYEPIKGTLAHGFSTSGQDVSTLFDPSYAWTAGAIVASAGDLANWAVALYGGSILSAAALATMLQTVPTGVAGESYGLGVFVLDASLTGAGPAWGHAGDINGYHSQMFYFPSAKAAVVAMVNSDAGDPNAISLAALDVLKL